MLISSELRTECVRLRVEEHLELRAIRDRTGVSVGALSALLRMHPLPAPLKAQRAAARGAQRAIPREDRFPNASPFLAFMKPLDTLSRKEKGRIAEAAVLLRLSLLGLIPAKPVFDGETSDWLVELPGRPDIKRIQVKWMKTGTHGQPFAPLTSTGSSGKVKVYTQADFDILVGYDIRTDRCYVWDWEAIGARQASVAADVASCEAWSRLLPQ